MSGRTVTLAGFMGSGKSTVGRILASRLRWPFKDTDDLIVDREGMPIARIFETKGEGYFRELERRVVLSTPEEGERILAVGGGGFNETTITYLKRISLTIHLDLTFREVLRRVGEDPRRPLLRHPNLLGLFLKRKRLYSRAHVRIWVEGLTVDETVDSILRLI